MKIRQSGWIALLVWLACAFPVLAQSAKPPTTDKKQTPANPADFSGVWAQESKTQIEWFDAQGNRLSELPMTPLGEQRFKANKATFGSKAVASRESTDPTTKCLPPGVPTIYLYIFPMEIIHTPGRVILFFEFGNYVRQIFTDGRPHQDFTPTWMGDSIGKWEGDTLVVDINGFNDKTWIDNLGHPHSDRLHIVERFRRTDHDHLVDDITLDDPITYTKTLTTKRILDLKPDWNVMEFICEDKDTFEDHEKQANQEKK
jgi:hypothetical protein